MAFKKYLNEEAIAEDIIKIRLWLKDVNKQIKSKSEESKKKSSAIWDALQKELPE